MSAYKNTINLPQFKLDMKADLPRSEPVILAQWRQEQDYDTVIKNRQGQASYTIHCGPPYANGRLHGGHLIPNILKDIVVRSRSMAGFDTPFVPGWDCHGLPIEWKVELALKKEGRNKTDISRRDFRQLCRDYALNWLTAQKGDWQRMGCLADWENPYITMAPATEASIIRTLGKVAESGLLYRDYRPVMWSPVERTALAEAEIEYADKTSTAVHFTFALEARRDEYLVAWTTTPWSIPGNQAVAVHNEIDYVLLRQANDSRGFWVSEERANDFIKAAGLTAAEVTDCCNGAALAGLNAVHPFYNRSVPVIHSNHVTAVDGTGVVHIAPAHGLEDFDLGRAYSLPLHSLVDGSGQYEGSAPDLSRTGQKLAGVAIHNAEQLIIDELAAAGSLLASQPYTHSYPVSWRSKTPLIYRTTSQWFIAMDKPYTSDGKTLRERALEEIRNVEWTPEDGHNRLAGMLRDRPDWCISRQRVWGVPIPIMKNTADDSYILDNAVFSHISGIVKQNGIDAWDEFPAADLLPPGWAKANGVDPARLHKETDILDVWFDSGASYQHVLKERSGLAYPADLYLEGSDQHRGWFQSSLLLSLITDNQAPFRQVATHGFLVDSEGKKISKSSGNGADAITLMERYGADNLRLWVASSNYSGDIKFGPEIMAGVQENYRKIRNTLRFVLGNISDYREEEHAVPFDKLPEMERWALARYAKASDEIAKGYEQIIPSAAVRALVEFCGNDMSNKYLDMRKDTLYCDVANAPERRAAQTVLHHIAKGLLTHMAPVLPFTADQAWRLMNGPGSPVYAQPFYTGPAEWRAPSLIDRWETVLSIRDQVNVAIEQGRAAGAFARSAQLDLHVKALPDAANILLEIGNLSAVFQTASVRVEPAQKFTIEINPSANPPCPRCRISYEPVADDLCRRCFNAVSVNSSFAQQSHSVKEKLTP